MTFGQLPAKLFCHRRRLFPDWAVYDILTKIIENELKEYCIHNKCVGVVMDNASNFVNAFKESAVTEVLRKKIF